MFLVIDMRSLGCAKRILNAHAQCYQVAYYRVKRRKQTDYQRTCNLLFTQMKRNIGWCARLHQLFVVSTDFESTDKGYREGSWARFRLEAHFFVAQKWARPSPVLKVKPSVVALTSSSFSTCKLFYWQMFSNLYIYPVWISCCVFLSSNCNHSDKTHW